MCKCCLSAGDDPHNGRAQVAGAGQGGGGGREPHVDGVGVPAARADAVRVRRGRHARAARQNRQVLQGEKKNLLMWSKVTFYYISTLRPRAL